MLKNEKQFIENLKQVLSSDDGLLVESEGAVFVRSVEGDNYTAGILCDAGGIDDKIEFESDLDGAIRWFLAERGKRGHGSEW